MKIYWLLSLLALLLGVASGMESIEKQPKSLKVKLHEKKDRSRILLLYARDEAQPSLLEQQKSLNESKAGLTERDLEVIILVASQMTEPDRHYLMHNYKLNPAVDFSGWLIGKDGDLKQTYEKPVAVKDLFRLIDSMPMRRQEMKN